MTNIDKLEKLNVSPDCSWHIKLSIDHKYDSILYRHLDYISIYIREMGLHTFLVVPYRPRVQVTTKGTEQHIFNSY